MTIAQPRPSALTPPASSVPPDLRLPGLSVILPCYDEQDNVGPAVDEALAAGRRCADAVEVIVVDDGSQDGTRAAAASKAVEDRCVRVVVHEHNRGYGAAVRSGIRASRMPWVLLTDGDRQFDLGELRDLLPLAEDHDLVAGYRIARSDPVGRRAAGAGWNWLMRRTFGVPVRDVDCAFKLIRGDLLRGLDLHSDGAMISAELLTRAQQDGFRITEAGVHHRPRVAGAPTGGDPRVVLRALRERRALRRELSRPVERSVRARRPARLLHD
jgi:glycosyltransferase involved in cell wall biosynthesis